VKNDFFERLFSFSFVPHQSKKRAKEKITEVKKMSFFAKHLLG